MRLPVSPLSWWKRTVLRDTAEYSLTGTLTRPKEIAPLQIDRGMRLILLHGLQSRPDFLQLVLRELEVDGLDRVQDRLRAARAGDRDDDRAECQQPGQRDALRRDAVPVGDLP